jgi:hypothetical protein
MVIRVVEFSREGTKLERFLPKNQHIQRKFLNFENWDSSALSEIRHHFSNEEIQKLMLSKNVMNKNVLLNWYCSLKNKLRKVQMIFNIEN